MGLGVIPSSFTCPFFLSRASQVMQAVKNLQVNAGEDVKDAGLFPGSGRSPGRGHGNPLLYSCLENPKDRGDWWGP